MTIPFKVFPVGTTFTEKRKRNAVLRAYVYRHTGEHKSNASAKPTHATDSEWINDHAFYVTKQGNLSAKHKYCMSAYLAE